MKRRILAAVRTYEDVLEIIDRAFQLRQLDRNRFNEMLEDIKKTAGKLDATTIYDFFRFHDTVYECESLLATMDSACVDKLVDYAEKYTS